MPMSDLEEKQNENLELYKAKLAASQEAKAQAEAAAQPDKIPGMPTKKERALGPQEAAAFSKAVMQGARLGEPSGYGGQGPLTPQQQAAATGRMQAGQQEFNEPIAVTRGMTTTYQGPRYGEELASPGQAAQAFKRELVGQKGFTNPESPEYIGGWVPEGGTKAAQEAKALGTQYQMKKEDYARNWEDFTNLILSDEAFVVKDPNTKKVMLDEKRSPIMDPNLVQLTLKYKALARTDPIAAFETFKEEAGKILSAGKINADSVSKAMENFARTQGRPLNEAEKSFFLNPQSDPKGEEMRRTRILEWMNYVPKTAPPYTGTIGPGGGGRRETYTGQGPAFGMEVLSAGAGPPAGATPTGAKSSLFQNIELSPAGQNVANWVNQNVVQPFRQPLGISLRPREERESGEYERRLKPITY